MYALLPVLVLGCAQPDPSCDAMCEAAASLYGACLEDWGVSWEAAGFVDEVDFVGRCETWAWEMHLLEDAAVDRGDLDKAGIVDETCATREVALSAEDATCAAYTDIDWSTVPWDPEPDAPPTE